jgi:hypothetical protein
LAITRRGLDQLSAWKVKLPFAVTVEFLLYISFKAPDIGSE